MSGRRGEPRVSTGAVVVGSADQFGSLVIFKSKEFVKKHPVISLTWVLGLLISILATGFTPAPESVQKYEEKLAMLNDGALAEAEDELEYWADKYQRSRGMFWGCDDDCTQKKREYENKRRIYNSINAEYRRKLAEAKSELGLFSQDGVEETKDLFWRKVAGGKQFAKRATMWDAVFMGLGATSRRDEGLVAIIVRLAFRVLVNLTVGLFKAVVEFLFSVWRVIWSYNPDPVTTMAFFAMAAVAALSLLATWLLGLAALGVGGVYAVAKVAETAQIEAARQQGQDPRANRYVQQQPQHSYQQRAYQSQQQQQARQRRPPARAAGSQQQSSTASTQGSAAPGWDHLD